MFEVKKIVSKKFSTLIQYIDYQKNYIMVIDIYSFLYLYYITELNEILYVSHIGTNEIVTLGFIYPE